jgi:hypothetical protein
MFSRGYSVFNCNSNDLIYTIDMYYKLFYKKKKIIFLKDILIKIYIYCYFFKLSPSKIVSLIISPFP